MRGAWFAFLCAPLLVAQEFDTPRVRVTRSEGASPSLQVLERPGGVRILLAKETIDIVVKGLPEEVLETVAAGNPPDPSETPLFASEFVRVWRRVVAVGGNTTLHAHPDRLVLALGEQRYLIEGGGERTRRQGQIQWADANSEMIRNLAEVPLESLLIELLPLPGTDVDPLLKDARIAYTKGDYAAALALAEKSWKLAETLPARDPRRYEAVKLLSSICAAKRDYQAADTWIQFAINWREVVNGAGDPLLANDLIDSVMIARGTGDLDRALVILSRVRTMHLNAHGMNSQPVADDFSRGALLLVEKQNLEEAAGSFRVALQIREKLEHAEHPSLLQDLDHLAATLVTLRQYEKAEEPLRRALLIRERHFGPSEPDLIATLDGLAYALFGQKKYAEAEPVYQRLLALWESSAGTEHPMVALTLDKMAIFYREQEKWDQATEAAGRALAVRSHFQATGLLLEAAQALARGLKSEARGHYKRALEVLDPGRADLEAFRKRIEKNLSDLEEDPPKPQEKQPRPH